jgi:hypothetical protein
MSFEAFAIIELFGHSRIAGKVTEETIGGGAFIRVDVPEINGQKAFTKYLGDKAIYAMTPVDEETARLYAESISAKPVELWQLPERIRRLAATIPDDDEELILYDDGNSETEDDDRF